MLRVFVHGEPFQPCIIFASKARAFPSETPLFGRLQALPTNMRLGWKSLAWKYKWRNVYSFGQSLQRSLPAIHHFINIMWSHRSNEWRHDTQQNDTQHQGDLIGRFFNIWLLFTWVFLKFHLNKQFQNTVCCTYFNVLKLFDATTFLLSIWAFEIWLQFWLHF